MMEVKCKRGDIYMAELSADEDGGSLHQGVRPILIISNDKANLYNPVVTVVPFTSKLRKHSLPLVLPQIPEISLGSHIPHNHPSRIRMGLCRRSRS